MTINEAITRLCIIEELLATDFCQPDADAIKLGIEALKRIHTSRLEHALANINPLPGETKE